METEYLQGGRRYLYPLWSDLVPRAYTTQHTRCSVNTGPISPRGSYQKNAWGTAARARCRSERATHLGTNGMCLLSALRNVKVNTPSSSKTEVAHASSASKKLEWLRVSNREEARYCRNSSWRERVARHTAFRAHKPSTAGRLEAMLL